VGFGCGAQLKRLGRAQGYRVRIEAEGPFGAIEPLEYLISVDDLDDSRAAPSGNLHAVAAELHEMTKATKDLKTARSQQRDIMEQAKVAANGAVGRATAIAERGGSQDPSIRDVEYVRMFAKVAQCSSRPCSMHSTSMSTGSVCCQVSLRLPSPARDRSCRTAALVGLLLRNRQGSKSAHSVLSISATPSQACRRIAKPVAVWALEAIAHSSSI
jgi:hypothetical protein